MREAATSIRQERAYMVPHIRREIVFQTRSEVMY